MGDALLVGGADGFYHGDAHVEELFERQAAGQDQVFERASPDKLHGDEVKALGLVDLKDGDDVGVVEGGDGPGFALEHGKPLGA